MSEQSDANFLEQLASEVRATSNRLSDLEQQVLLAQLGMGTPARAGFGLGGLPSPQGGGIALGGGPVEPATEIALGVVTADKLSVGRSSGAGNSVSNPSFEDVVGSAFAVDWLTGYQSTGAGATYGQHASASSGALAAFITVAATTDGGSIASRAIPVTPGDVYFCSVMIGASGASTSGLYFRADFGTSSSFTLPGALSQLPIIPDSSPIPAVYAKQQGYVTVPAGRTWMRLVVYNFLPATARTMVIDDVVAERQSGGLKNSDSNVVIDASGISVTGGKITVTQPGTGTAIIDGTSMMFKIGQSGTQTLVFPAAGNTSRVIILSAFGSGYSLPTQFLATVRADASGATGLGATGGFDDTNVTTAGVVSYRAFMRSRLQGSGVVVELYAQSATVNPGFTATGRYYILLEAGI
jgi:hypothetical protein